MSVLRFDALERVPDWEAARSILMRAFRESQDAARDGSPIVYVVHYADLLGQRGAPSAMVATGLLSAARTAAVELARAGVPVNVIAVGDDTTPEAVERWAGYLTERDGPTGEVVRLDPGHLGKALP